MRHSSCVHRRGIQCRDCQQPVRQKKSQFSPLGLGTHLTVHRDRAETNGTHKNEIVRGLGWKVIRMTTARASTKNTKGMPGVLSCWRFEKFVHTYRVDFHKLEEIATQKVREVLLQNVGLLCIRCYHSYSRLRRKAIAGFPQGIVQINS